MPSGVYLHKPCLEETKAKIRLALKGRPLTEEHKANMSKALFGRHLSEETRIRMSLAKTGKPHSEEAKTKLRLAHLGKHPSKEHRVNLSLALTGRHLSKGHRTNIGQAQKLLWGDLEYKNKVVKAMRLACQAKPNKAEVCLAELLETNYPNEWAYVGSGQLIIGGKCPDFMNINSKKQLIELYGDYWHEGEDPQDRIDLFGQYGFDCLVIWERELTEPQEVLKKVANFTKGGIKDG